MTKPLIQIGFNPVVAKLFGADDDVKVIVSTLLSYHVDGYEHMDAFKSRGWDGRSNFFNWNPATFPRGFVDDVEKALISRGYNVQRVCHPLPAPEGPEVPKVDSFGEQDRYDYQMETVRRLLKRGVMIARVATGGGKSRIAKLATARLNLNTLFLTNRKPLLYQMKRSYEDSGFDCGMMGDGEWEPNAMLNCAMVQTLVNRLAEPEDGDNSSTAMRQHRIRARTIAYLQTVEFIIGEEAHEAGGNSYYEVLQHCKKAQYRLALTATPFMRDSEESNMRLKAAFGPIGIEVSEKLLIDRGILARPIFKYVSCAAPKQLRKSTPYARAVELGIVENLFRNTAIVNDVRMAATYGLTSMVLVMRKAHGEALLAMMKAVGLRAVYIHGDKNQDARDKALGQLSRGEIDVLIGTNILDVGIDVPAVGLVILAGGGKAEVSLRQRIGRGLREKKKGPNVCLIIDYQDETNNHLRKHAYSRRQIVEQTPGFVENILAANDDFDYEKLGFRRNGNALAA
jgi:superfamily II DNA or RNA helicase